MQAKYFEDLEVWKLSRNLTNQVYGITKEKSFSKDFGLTEQIRRSAVSIMSNIAEGFERGGNKEFIQYLYIAKGSCGGMSIILCKRLLKYYHAKGILSLNSIAN